MSSIVRVDGRLRSPDVDAIADKKMEDSPFVEVKGDDHNLHLAIYARIVEYDRLKTRQLKLRAMFEFEKQNKRLVIALKKKYRQKARRVDLSGAIEEVNNLLNEYAKKIKNYTLPQNNTVMFHQISISKRVTKIKNEITLLCDEIMHKRGLSTQFLTPSYSEIIGPDLVQNKNSPEMIEPDLAQKQNKTSSEKKQKCSWTLPDVNL